MVKIRAAVISIWFLAVASAPLHARSLVILQDGTRISGEIGDAEYRFVTVEGAELVLSRASLHRLEVPEHGGVSVVLKDGTLVTGELKTAIHVVDGLLTRILQPGDLSVIDFDIYIPLEPGGKLQNICPIRLGLPLNVLQGERPATFSSGLTTSVRCEGAFVSRLEIKLRKSVTEQYVRKGSEPRKGFELAVAPVVFLPAGDDQEVNLTFTLVQEGREIARGSRLFEGGEGELNSYPPIKLWYPTGAIDASGPTPILRVQMVTAKSKREREKGSVFWWFTIRL
jgi:hypothetical protein